MATPKVKENVVDNQNISTCQKQKIVSDIVNYSDKSCVIKTHHLSCLGLEVQPRRKWFSPYCARKKIERRNQTRHLKKIFFGTVY